MIGWLTDTKVAVSDGLTMEGGHIMISYQWGTKPTMLRVRDKLTQAGYKVWMDVDNMCESAISYLHAP